jgi:hydroxymethylbilane synthase
VAAGLVAAHPGVAVELVHITTQGDRSQSANTPLSSYAEKGVFAKELEQALLEGSIDFAVHSMKDLAAVLPDDLVIAAVPERQDARDVIIGAKFDNLPAGARVGTGSARRRALISERRPDLTVLEIRGNVDTRLRKLSEGDYDAIVLAAAGLNRLGRESVIREFLDPEWFIPDPGQGALAIETRRDRTDVREIAGSINDADTAQCVAAERAYLAALGGGCSMPVGAWASCSLGRLSLRAMLANEAGRVRRVALDGDIADAERVGTLAAESIRHRA